MFNLEALHMNPKIFSDFFFFCPELDQVFTFSSLDIGLFYLDLLAIITTGLLLACPCLCTFFDCIFANLSCFFIVQRLICVL